MHQSCELHEQRSSPAEVSGWSFNPCVEGASDIRLWVGQPLYFPCRYSPVTLTYPPRVQASRGTSWQTCCGTRRTQRVENATWPTKIQTSLWGASRDGHMHVLEGRKSEPSGQQSICWATWQRHQSQAEASCLPGDALERNGACLSACVS